MLGIARTTSAVRIRRADPLERDSAEQGDDLSCPIADLRGDRLELGGLVGEDHDRDPLGQPGVRGDRLAAQFAGEGACATRPPVGREHGLTEAAGQRSCHVPAADEPDRHLKAKGSGPGGRVRWSGARRYRCSAVTHDERGDPDGTAAWHRRLHHTGRDQLSEETAQTPGMRRYEAISGARNGSRKIWMGESRVGPGMISADHHHGDAETGIYVVSGHPVFVFLDGGDERRVATEPGDYVYVPPFVPHREENPSPDEHAVVVLARSTQEGIVVNLPSLRAAVPELDRMIDERAGEKHR